MSLHNFWFGYSEYPAHYWRKGDRIIDSCAKCGKAQAHPIHIYNPRRIWRRVIGKITRRLIERKEA